MNQIEAKEKPAFPNIQHQSNACLPTHFGNFMVHVFQDVNEVEHIAMVAGSPVNGCLVRLHSECATGDIMGSLRCDCREQLETSLQKIAEEGAGLLIYMRGHEGRGIGLANKIRAYGLQEKGFDTVEANLRLGFPADMRRYGCAVEILQYFGLSRIRLLTNNWRKIDFLKEAGIVIEKRVPLWTTTNEHNAKYIGTKKRVLGHLPACKSEGLDSRASGPATGPRPLKIVSAEPACDIDGLTDDMESCNSGALHRFGG